MNLKKNVLNYYGAVALCFAMGMLTVSCASASVVQRVSLPQVVQGSQLVFEGKVISKQVRIASNSRPFTYFTFQVLDVIKGAYAAPTIELGYMGGPTPDGLVMQISDMRMPKVGEHGIYFVESINRQQVHPLYGWQQGHYLVVMPQAGALSRVVPVNAPANAMTAAPSLIQFKQQVRALAGGGK